MSFTKKGSRRTPAERVEKRQQRAKVVETRRAFLAELRRVNEEKRAEKAAEAIKKLGEAAGVAGEQMKDFADTVDKLQRAEAEAK